MFFLNKNLTGSYPAENRSARNEFSRGFRNSGFKNRRSAKKITFAFNHDFWLPVCPLVLLARGLGRGREAAMAKAETVAIFGRTELRKGVSKANKCQEAHGDVRY